MCRIFFNPSTISFDEIDLLEFFTKLETESGGDGNGVYRITSDKLDKSATLMPDTDIREPFIFHTRKATHGQVKDYNAQPFLNGRYALVHNGVFSSANKPSILLGLYDNDKYSDSYKIHYVIEKVGISKFYMAFVKSSYGVILIHDKKVNLTYLLKTSGVFRSATIKDKYIYGSSQLEFWQVDKDSIELIDDGMYILKESGLIKLHEPETTTYSYSQTYSGYNRHYYPDTHASWWEENESYSDYYDKLRKKNKEKKIKTIEYFNDDDDQDVIAIENLFDTESLFYKYCDDLFKCDECKVVYSNLSLGGFAGKYPLCKTCLEKLQEIIDKNTIDYNGETYFQCNRCNEFHTYDDLGGYKDDYPYCINCLEKEAQENESLNREYFNCGICGCLCSKEIYGGTIKNKDCCKTCFKKIKKRIKKIQQQGVYNEIKCYECAFRFMEGDVIYIDENGYYYCQECNTELDSNNGFEDRIMISFDECVERERGI